MKKILLLNIVCLAVFVSAMAQNTAKFTLDKSMYLKSNEPVDVLIQGDVAAIKKLIEAEGGKFQYAAGDIAKVYLPMQSIDKITSDKAIQRIEILNHKVRPMNDTMLKNNNILQVHSGQAPLTQGYDGTGVVVGFIDTGIDFTHPDFQDNLHHSRVKYLWDQNLTGTPPTGYSYGVEFTNTQLDAGLDTLSSDVNNCAGYPGHGTHVAGVGVGNGLASNSYKGAAPNADIIMVAMSWCSGSQSSILDGVNYIYAKATAMGEPCVINISLGGQVGGVNSTYSSHDGMDLEAQAINNLMNAQSGRALVAAAGNDGSNPIHLGYTLAAGDTNFTMFYPPSAGNLLDLQLYGSVADMTNLKFSIGADEMTPTHSNRGHIHFSTMFPLGPLRNDTLYNAGNRIGVIQSIAHSPYAGTYEIEFLIAPDSGAYNWRLIVSGTGKFDLWNYGLVGAPLPSPTTMPDSIHYKLPDANKTVCTSFQCLQNVITVGNYTNRRSYQDYFNVLYLDATKVPGRIDASSSIGPTMDGRTKPDVAAPGDMTVAAIPLSYISTVVSCCTNNLSLDSMHVRDGGTSHSCPSVAGIAALYLQKNPTATAAQVRAAIDGCTTVDTWTGTVPNNVYGYGKANAFAALTNCSITGVANNNTSLATTLSIYPNPSFTGNAVNIDVSNYKTKDKMELNIYNAVGELVKTISVTSSTVQLNGSLQAGIYFCNLIVNGTKVQTKKLVIL